MKPITRTTEKVVDELLKVRTEDINKKLDEISTKLTTKPKDEKIEDIIRKMKEKIPEKIIRREQDIVKPESDVEKKTEDKKDDKKEPEHVHDDVFCPTCGKGHIHKMESSGLTMKCADGKCGEELFVIPKSADHSCSECGFPIKKPSDDKVIEACPFCKNDKAIPFSNGKPMIKFDFSKMKK